MNVSPRLRALAELVPVDTDGVADLGTDHGRLAVALLLGGRARRVVATDLRERPLSAARATIRGVGLEDRVELRLGDGFDALRDDDGVTCACIAGLGGASVASMLERARTSGGLEPVERLVLNPIGGARRVRAWLRDRAWRLVTERRVVERGRGYDVLSAVRVRTREESDGPYRALDAPLGVALRVGPSGLHDPSGELVMHFARERDHAADVLRALRDAGSELSPDRVRRAIAKHTELAHAVAWLRRAQTTRSGSTSASAIATSSPGTSSASRARSVGR